MAVKKKKQKANERKTLLNRAVKIKCCYCEIKEGCTRRMRKEKLEESGCMTYCTLTPNVPKKQKKNISNLSKR